MYCRSSHSKVKAQTGQTDRQTRPNALLCRPRRWQKPNYKLNCTKYLCKLADADEHGTKLYRDYKKADLIPQHHEE